MIHNEFALSNSAVGGKSVFVARFGHGTVGYGMLGAGVDFRL